MSTTNFTVFLAYSDYPSISDREMNGASKRFQTVVKKLKGISTQLDLPRYFGEEWFEVSGCSYEDIEKKWKDERFWIYLKNYEAPKHF